MKSFTLSNKPEALLPQKVYITRVMHVASFKNSKIWVNKLIMDYKTIDFSSSKHCLLKVSYLDNLNFELPVILYIRDWLLKVGYIFPPQK